REGAAAGSDAERPPGEVSRMRSSARPWRRVPDEGDLDTPAEAGKRALPGDRHGHVGVIRGDGQIPTKPGAVPDFAAGADLAKGGSPIDQVGAHGREPPVQRFDGAGHTRRVVPGYVEQEQESGHGSASLIAYRRAASSP